MYAPFTFPPPFCAMGDKVDFVYLIATMPGTCIGVDTSFTKSRKLPRHPFYILLRQGDGWVTVDGQLTTCIKSKGDPLPCPPWSSQVVPDMRNYCMQLGMVAPSQLAQTSSTQHSPEV